MEISEEILDREVGHLKADLTPFGYLDIEAAVKAALEVGYDGKWVGKEVKRYMDDNGVNIDDVDPVAVVYEALFEEARNDIYQETYRDIGNLRESIYVYGNFIDTQLDYTEGAQKATANVISDIPKDEWTDAIKWLVKEAELGSIIDYNIADEADEE